MIDNSSDDSNQLQVNAASESSEDEIPIIAKSNKCRRRTINSVISDDSDDENVESQSFPTMNENLDVELESKKSASTDTEPENDKVAGEKERSLTKVFKKRRTIIANDSDSDDNELVEKASNTPINRRQAREKLSQSTGKGSAIQKLIKQRKKIKSKKNNNDNDDSNNDLSASSKRKLKKEAKKNNILDSDNDFNSDSETKAVVKKSRKHLEDGNAANDGVNVEEGIPEEEASDESLASESSGGDGSDSEMPIERKSYGTRMKSSKAKAVETDEEEEEKRKETLDILGNTDLYAAESSDSETEAKRSDDGDGDGEEGADHRKRKHKLKDKVCSVYSDSPL